jgi:P27 family predicted phage terminase small subunit
MGVLTEADGPMLANLCMAVSTFAHALEKVDQLGIVYKAKSGNLLQNPWLQIANQSVDLITKLSRKFGLSPASRAKLMGDRQTESDAGVIDLDSYPLFASCSPDVSYTPNVSNPLAITSGDEEGLLDDLTEGDSEIIDVVACPPDVTYLLAITSGNEEDRQGLKLAVEEGAVG